MCGRQKSPSTMTTITVGIETRNASPPVCFGPSKVSNPIARIAAAANFSGGRALPIDITRSLDVSWYQLVSTQNEARSRDEAPHFKRSRIYDIPCTLMMLTRLAVGLEPLNALDAAHRSPRSVSGIGSPVDPALAGPLSETKN